MAVRHTATPASCRAMCIRLAISCFDVGQASEVSEGNDMVGVCSYTVDSLAKNSSGRHGSDVSR
jgi:hypothetical protein